MGISLWNLITKSSKKIFEKKFWKKNSDKKILEKSFDKKNFDQKIYSNIDKYDIIFALLASFDKNKAKDRE